MHVGLMIVNMFKEERTDDCYLYALVGLLGVFIINFFKGLMQILLLYILLLLELFRNRLNDQKIINYKLALNYTTGTDYYVFSSYLSIISHISSPIFSVSVVNLLFLS